MAQTDSRISSLRGPVETASGKLVAGMATLATVGSYLFVVTAATTHEQLLRDTSAQLPIINVAVPASWFAVFAPAVLFVLTCVVVMHAHTLAHRSSFFEQELQQMPLRSERAFHRAITNTVTLGYWQGDGQDTGARNALTVALPFLVLAVFPMLVLLSIQARFLPYHGSVLTWFHRTVVLAMVGLTGVHIPFILFPGFAVAAKARRAVFGNMLAALAFVPAVALSLFVLHIPDEVLERATLRLLPARFIKEVPSRPDGSNVLMFARSGAPTPRPRQMTTLTYRLLEAPSTPFGLRRNLDIARVNLVQSSPTESQINELGYTRAWQRYGRGFNLAGRDLRYADFSGTDLRRADIRGADLRGATLAGANLDHVDARSLRAELASNCGEGGAPECPTRLQFALLDDATFRHAVMTGASLFGSSAAGANFEGADMFMANLKLSNLRDAKFLATDLRSARMSGADASKALFLGVQISGLTAIATDFSRTVLVERRDGWTMPRSEEEWVNLRGALLQGADIAVRYALLDLAHPGFRLSVYDWVAAPADGSWLRWRRAPSEFDEALALFIDKALRDDIAKEIRIELPQASSEVIDPLPRWKADQGRQTEKLIAIGCQNGDGEIEILFGLLRRASIERDLIRMNIDAERVFSGEEAAENLKEESRIWEDLEAKLSDVRLCGDAANTVRRHLYGRW